MPETSLVGQSFGVTEVLARHEFPRAGFQARVEDLILATPQVGVLATLGPPG